MKVPSLQIETDSEGLQCCGIPPSWTISDSADVSGAGADLGSSAQPSIIFANDGTFLQQFAETQDLPHQGAEADNGIDETASHANPAISVNSIDGVGGERFTADVKPKKSLLAAFSTKKKEVRPSLISNACWMKFFEPPTFCFRAFISASAILTFAAIQAKPVAAVSTGPETEDQVKKRKRDEYLAEMAKYRNTSCADSGGKHPLVK